MPAHHHEHGEDCHEVFARLSEYLDRELAPADCERLREHIEGCEPCVEFLDSLKRSIGVCHGFQAQEKPTPLADDAKAELRAAYERMLAAKKEQLP